MGASGAPTSERLTTPIELRNGMVTFKPAPETMSPVVDRSRAVLAADAQTQSAPGERSRPYSDTVAVFGLFTDRTFGPLTAGSVNPTYLDVPVWIVVHRRVEVASAGPPGQKGVVQVADVVTAVDSSTGNPLLSYTEPTGAFARL